MKDVKSIYKWQQKKQKDALYDSHIRKPSESFPTRYGIYIELELCRPLSYYFDDKGKFWHHSVEFENLLEIFNSNSHKVMTDEEDDEILDYIESGIFASSENRNDNYCFVFGGYCFVYYKQRIGIFLSGRSDFKKHRNFITFYTEGSRPLILYIRKYKRLKLQTSHVNLYENAPTPIWDGNSYFVRGIMREMFGWE